jgi:polyphosphate kinase
MARNSQKQKLFNGRDHSWMQFNRRVLEEAEDSSNPLLERVKFLAITANNLDEYVEVRQAGLMQRIEDGYREPGYDGLRPAESLAALTAEIHSFVAAQYSCWNEQLLPELSRQGIRLLEWKELGEEARAFAQGYFQREVDPLLTPISIDPAHPFPRVLNKALCLALLLRAKRRRSSPQVLGVVTVPRALPRFVRLPAPDGTFDYLLLQDLIAQNLAGMYRGYQVLAHAAFRVTRNSNLYFEEEEARSLLETIRVELHNRRKGDAVRLEIEAGADPEIVERLRVNFELDEDQVFRGDGPVNLSRLMFFYGDVRRPELKFPSFTPKPLKLSPHSANILDELRLRDILLHHPYDSDDPVVDFIEQGAKDPAVLSMKQTLYRTSHESPMFEALIEAAATKETTLVVELMARFDEASNISWARSMEDAGVQVFHGVVGLKTHCKLAMLVRRDEDGQTRRYCHLGTGNYNPVTARFYTDLSLLTSADYRARPHGLQLPDRPRRNRRLSPIAGGAPDHGRELPGPHSPRAGTCQGRPPRAHRGQDERPARTQRHRGSLPGFPGRRRNRPDRPRPMHSAPRRQRAVGTDSSPLHRRPLSGALPHLPLCQRRQRRNLPRLGRLDAPQPLRALRSSLSGPLARSPSTHPR